MFVMEVTKEIIHALSCYYQMQNKYPLTGTPAWRSDHTYLHSLSTLTIALTTDQTFSSWSKLYAMEI